MLLLGLRACLKWADSCTSCYAIKSQSTSNAKRPTTGGDLSLTPYIVTFPGLQGWVDGGLLVKHMSRGWDGLFRGWVEGGLAPGDGGLKVGWCRSRVGCRWVGPSASYNSPARPIFLTQNRTRIIGPALRPRALSDPTSAGRHSLLSDPTSSLIIGRDSEHRRKSLSDQPLRILPVKV